MRGLARIEANLDLMEGLADSFTGRLQARFFARPTVEKGLGSLFGGQRPPPRIFSLREKVFGDLLGFGNRPDAFDINADVMPASDGIKSERVGMGQVEGEIRRTNSEIRPVATARQRGERKAEFRNPKKARSGGVLAQERFAGLRCGLRVSDFLRVSALGLRL